MISISDAARALRAGHVVAIPTETVYGLAANALDVNAVSQIFSLKNRPQDNPLIVHIGSIDRIQDYAYINSPLESLLMQKFMPGPFTLLLQKKDCVPSVITANSDWVAIRVPQHDLCQQLLHAVGIPLAAPSANISGRPSPTNADMVYNNFGDRVPILDGGDCLIGIESTVVQVVDNIVLIHRPGFITIEDLQDVLGSDIVQYAHGIQNISPGVKYPHYSPNARIHWLHDVDVLSLSQSSVIIATSEWLAENSDYSCGFYERGSRSNPLACAQNLYRFYHQADLDGYTDIYVEKLDEIGVGYAIMNRVRKSMAH